MQDVSTNWLYDAFQKLTKNLTLVQCSTKDQRADIFTRAFPKAQDWYSAAAKINIDVLKYFQKKGTASCALVAVSYRHFGIRNVQGEEVLYRFFNPTSTVDRY